MVDHPHLSASSAFSSCSSSRDLYAEFGVSNPNDPSHLVGHSSEGATSLSSSVRGEDHAEKVVSSSIPCVAMGESEPSPLALSLSTDESFKDEDSNVGFLGIPANPAIQDIFKAAHHFAQNDRIEATAERKKNLDLLNFLAAHGHSVSEVNEFVRTGGSSPHNLNVLHELEVRSSSHVQLDASALPPCPTGSWASGVQPRMLTNSHSPLLASHKVLNPHDAKVLQVDATPGYVQYPLVNNHSDGRVVQCPLDNSSKAAALHPACPLAANQTCADKSSPTNFPLLSTPAADLSKGTVGPAPKRSPALKRSPATADVTSELPAHSSFFSKPLGYSPAPTVGGSLPKHAATLGAPFTANVSTELPATSKLLSNPLGETPSPSAVGSLNKSAAPISWSSLVASDSSKAPLQLEFFPPIVANGQISIRPPNDILKKGSNLWSSCLVGRFLHSRLPFKMVEENSFKLWAHLGLQKVFLHGKDSFIFKFAAPADRDNILALGPWYLSNKLLHLQHWKEGMSFQDNSCTKTPIWVKFHHIPLSYWTPEGLSYLASGIGKPLFVDKQTEKMEPMNFARVCIEITVDSALPDSIFAAVLNDDSDAESVVEIKVDYQNRPASCHICKSFGHTIYKCPQTNFQWIPKAKAASPAMSDLVDGQVLKAPDVLISPVHPVVASVPSSAGVPGSSLNIAIVKGDHEWTTVNRGRGAASSPSPVITSPEHACTPVSNAFMAIADATELNLSSPDVTPKPNPLIDKLKLVDEKEGRDLKNKDRSDQNQAATPKKKNRRNGGRKSPT